MQRYMTGIVIFGFGPLLYAALYYISDTWRYLSEGDTDDILIWQVSSQYSQQHMHFVETNTAHFSHTLIVFCITQINYFIVLLKK